MSSNVSPAKPSAPPTSDADRSPKKRSRENKFDPSLLPESSDAAEILKQVEFYFSDANLPRDKFLWTLAQSDPKKQGWVQIEQIASFKRMQRFKPLAAIVEALRQSKELLEVSEDGTAVRRRTLLVKPTNEEFKEQNSRTVYAKGFGDETPTLQIDLETYFRGFGKIESLRLRRTDTGMFKGSVLVQFESQSDADKFLSEPREWNGSLLDTKAKAAWVEEKKAEDEKLTWDERRERDKKREQESGSQKHFSAFKEMQKSKEQGRKDSRKGRKENKSRARPRSRDPKETDSAPAESAEKRTAQAEEAPSLFSNKREMLDDVPSKRGAEEELNGEAKRAKVDEQ